MPGGDYNGYNALDVGLGLRPDLTGRGMGLAFLQAILDFAKRQYETDRFRATITAFNRRSLRIFEKAGFRPLQTFMSASAHPIEFVVVVKEPALTDERTDHAGHATANDGSD